MALRSKAARAAALAVALCAVFLGAGAQEPRPPAGTRDQQIFLFQYRPGPKWRVGVPMREQLSGHGAYYERLTKAGHVFAAGGYGDGQGGMAIILARDIGEARTLLAADPAIVSGVFVADLREWAPRFRGQMALP